MPQAKDDLGVQPEVAEEEASEGVHAEVDEAQNSVRKPVLESLVEGKDRAEDRQA
ncbi:MAG TPA: hypothetical protein VKE27_09900 [Candidatus Dormibacteraeota bacterium]|nr:hypothetical protein [Candidatus Dormibacteraeota bacterium]